MKRDDILRYSYLALPKAIASRPDVSAGEKLVLAALIERLGDNDTCWPGPETISKDIGLSRRGVQNAIQNLAKLGIIRIVGHGRNNVNVYAIDIGSAITSLRNECVTGSALISPQVAHLFPASSAMSAHEQPKGTTERKTKRTTERTELPEILRTDAFREAWAEWETHRRQIKKRLTPLAAKKQLAMLADLGESQAIHEIERAIAGGWQGFYPEKKTSANSASRSDDDSRFDSLLRRRRVTIEDEYRAALQFPRPTPEFVAEHPEIYRNGKTLEQTQAFWDKADAWRKAGGDVNSNRSLKNDYRKPYIHKGKLVEPDLDVPTL